jgi:predicted acyltransferase
MKSERLVSLDVLRGFTVMLMIFVNNGGGEQIFAPLVHSRWNGMTLCDMVFPFFLFIMGISTYLSLGKSEFSWTRRVALKVAKRTCLLFLIGLLINWFDMALHGGASDLGHLRIMAVMQRIALCYAATALLAMACSNTRRGERVFMAVIVVLLVVYGGIILLGGGYDYNADTNILARFDRAVLGATHLYSKSPVDPEGLLSTLPCIAHTMIGFQVARWTFAGNSGDARQRTQNVTLKLLLAGTVLVCVGFAVSFGLPLNKRIWSPSYALVTCGFAALLQGLLVWVIDLSRSDRQSASVQSSWSLPLIFGTNPLFLYIVSEVLASVFSVSGIHGALYSALQTVIGNGYWTSVGYAATFTAMHAAIGYGLWKRGIYIKL